MIFSNLANTNTLFALIQAEKFTYKLSESERGITRGQETPVTQLKLMISNPNFFMIIVHAVIKNLSHFWKAHHKYDVII